MTNLQLPKLDLDENARRIYDAAEANLSRYYTDVTTRRGLVTAIIGMRGQHVREEDEDQIERVTTSDLTEDELRQLLVLEEIFPTDRTQIMRTIRRVLINIAYHVPRDLALKAAQAAQIKGTLSFTPEDNHVLNIADYICKGLSLDEAEEYVSLMERREEITNNFLAQPEVKEILEKSLKENSEVDSEIFKRLELILNDAFSDEEKDRVKFLEAKMRP